MKSGTAVPLKFCSDSTTFTIRGFCGDAGEKGDSTQTELSASLYGHMFAGDIELELSRQSNRGAILMIAC